MSQDPYYYPKSLSKSKKSYGGLLYSRLNNNKSKAKRYDDNPDIPHNPQQPHDVMIPHADKECLSRHNSIPSFRSSTPQLLASRISP
ncbi:hypothetical protein DMENIID0001_005170 [Sergentomyia squamirostris]